jgi:hypothetical protein
MPKKAIIQGEFHISSQDQEDLLSRVTDDTDAVFVEGRKDNWGERSLTVGYSLFLIGVILFLWFQSALNRRYDSDVLTEIRERGVTVFDEIDRPLPQLYDDFSLRLKGLCAVVPLLMLLWGLLAPADINAYTIQSIAVNATPAARLMILAGAPVIFSLGLIFGEEFTHGARDDAMAASVINKSEEKR